MNQRHSQFEMVLLRSFHLDAIFRILPTRGGNGQLASGADKLINNCITNKETLVALKN